MRLKINNFGIYFSYPAVALITLIVLSNRYTDYLFCVFAVIIHELGHLIMMFALGLKPGSINVKLFNIEINKKSRYDIPFFKDFLITVFGPLFNLIFYFILYNFNRGFAYVNLFIGLFNLLPAAPLDGGQLVFLLLSRFFSRDLSARIIDIITIIICIPVFIFGFLVLFYSKYNFSLLILGVYLILTLFYRDEKYL